ncbi:hypothetical protein [Frigoribacterium sp. PhB24]|uniref:hypothetical protein n=1 Tax=Frigoribacterium sp. PhB24 TaxID=2485204 RepID=UPI000F486A64|nr:hypothetical protein [Frigoribacterium sp. PhB24]ROS54101.1 hypothetical protein EDF50_0176 [Frigoribacterium sp. PhB24]
MINLVAFVPALLTAAALLAARRASGGTTTRARRWSARVLAVWAAVAVVALAAFLVGLRLQHADLAVWSAFALIAAALAAVTAAAARVVSSFVR